MLVFRNNERVTENMKTREIRKQFFSGNKIEEGDAVREHAKKSSPQSKSETVKGSSLRQEYDKQYSRENIRHDPYSRSFLRYLQEFVLPVREYVECDV